MASRVRIGELQMAVDDTRYQHHLAHAYQSKTRPQCLCSADGVELYISRIGVDHYVTKRMPNTGSKHSPECDSYEPPLELSGAGQVIGAAINENADDGKTTLRVGFSLSKAPGRSPPARSAEADSATTARTDGLKLTLRGLLHYLFDEARFNRWSPAMEGKRSWRVIRKHLVEAATNKSVKGLPLSSMLYIPEPFVPEKKAELASRRTSFLARFVAPAKGPRHLALLIAEAKRVEPARFGFRLLVKHAPDLVLSMDEHLSNQIRAKFKAEIDMCEADESMHLVVFATLSMTAAGAGSLEEVVLMSTTQNWIPVSDIYEKHLIDQLTLRRRRFIKGLRYNLPASKPLAAALLYDNQPTAVYISRQGVSEEFSVELQGLIATSSLASVVWHTDSAIPEFAEGG